jgi:hypothetical protein
MHSASTVEKQESIHKGLAIDLREISIDNAIPLFSISRATPRNPAP